MKTENTVVIMPAVYDNYMTVTILDKSYRAIKFNIYSDNQIFGDEFSKKLELNKIDLEKNM